MLIRKEQVAALRDSLRVRFEDELVGHCRKFAPQLCQVAGESGVRKTVHTGVLRALEYGFADRVQARFYVELMLTLGGEFDTDPQFPWARETLRDKFVKAHVRAMLLHRDVTSYLDRVMGPNNEHVKEALGGILRLPPEIFLVGQQNVADAIRSQLRAIFPQKSEYLDEGQVEEIVAAAARQEDEFGLPKRCLTLPGVLLIFGHGATRDALYPWISNVLNDGAIISPEARLRRLYGKLHAYAANAQKNLP